MAIELNTLRQEGHAAVERSRRQLDAKEVSLQVCKSPNSVCREGPTAPWPIVMLHAVQPCFARWDPAKLIRQPADDNIPVHGPFLHMIVVLSTLLPLMQEMGGTPTPSNLASGAAAEIIQELRAR